MPINIEEIEQATRYAGRRHPWVDADDPSLTALDGVGPTIAERLRVAGIERPEDLQGKSQAELAAIEGIGASRAARIRSQVEFEMAGGSRRHSSKQTIVTETGGEREVRATVHRESGQTEVRIGGETGVEDADLERFIAFESGVGGIGTMPSTVSVTGPDKEEAIEDHAARSPESRRADESFNAPITLSYAQWAANPNRYDYPGVDTIPRSRRRERALERAGRLIERGGLREFKTRETTTSGFTPRINRLSLGRASDPEGTLAHELGHAVEHQLNDPFADQKLSHTLFDDPESLEQAERISERRRGEPVESTRRTYDTNIFEDEPDDSPFAGIDPTYPFGEELFADVYAGMVTEPRATRREAPEAVRKVESVVFGSGY